MKRKEQRKELQQAASHFIDFMKFEGLDIAKVYRAFGSERPKKISISSTSVVDSFYQKI